MVNIESWFLRVEGVWHLSLCMRQVDLEAEVEIHGGRMKIHFLGGLQVWRWCLRGWLRARLVCWDLAEA